MGETQGIEHIAREKKLKRKIEICSQPRRKSLRLMSVGPCKTGGQHSNEIIDLSDNDVRSCDDVIEGSSTDSKLQWCKMKLSSYLALRLLYFGVF